MIPHRYPRPPDGVPDFGSKLGSDGFTPKDLAALCSFIGKERLPTTEICVTEGAFRQMAKNTDWEPWFDADAMHRLHAGGAAGVKGSPEVIGMGVAIFVCEGEDSCVWAATSWLDTKMPGVLQAIPAMHQTIKWVARMTPAPKE